MKDKRQVVMTEANVSCPQHQERPRNKKDWQYAMDHLGEISMNKLTKPSAQIRRGMAGRCSASFASGLE
jgi:hypothetical protein